METTGSAAFVVNGIQYFLFYDFPPIDLVHFTRLIRRFSLYKDDPNKSYHDLPVEIGRDSDGNIVVGKGMDSSSRDEVIKEIKKIENSLAKQADLY